jgi:hypothetical protein
MLDIHDRFFSLQNDGQDRYAKLDISERRQTNSHLYALLWLFPIVAFNLILISKCQTMISKWPLKVFLRINPFFSSFSVTLKAHE